MGIRQPKVEIAETPGSSERQRIVTYTAQPGRIAYVGPIEITGTSSVNERIVRRQLTFRPGELFQASRLRESQRKLYSLELFNFVNVQPMTGAGDTRGAGRRGGPHSCSRDASPRASTARSTSASATAARKRPAAKSTGAM